MFRRWSRPEAADGAGAAPDHEGLRARYRAERDKRLRPDGNDQYLEPTGRFARMLDDPYVDVAPRAPVTDEVEFAFIGGGFAGRGLDVLGGRLRLADGAHEPEPADVDADRDHARDQEHVDGQAVAVGGMQRATLR